MFDELAEGHSSEPKGIVMKRYVYAGVLLCSMASASYAGTSEELPGWGQSIMELIKVNEKWALPVIFVLAFGESIAFVSLVLPFWGILVALGVILPSTDIGFWYALCAASIGAALGDWMSFWIGYRFKDTIAKVWPFTTHPDILPKGEVIFYKYGAWAIWLARFSGPLRASVPIVRTSSARRLGKPRLAVLLRPRAALTAGTNDDTNSGAVYKDRAASFF